MPNLTSLAKDTAIYGMSSIVGRFLNYLLVPLYTRVIDPATGGYGVVTNLYAYTALIMVLLTFGMETTYFRFANKADSDPDSVFTTAFLFVSTLSAAFLALVVTLIAPIASAMGYAGHHDYVLMMATVVAIDAIQAIPFALLRFRKRPLLFASLKLFFIVLNIGLNCLCYIALGLTDVVYVFAINLGCTAVATFAFVPELRRIRWHTDGTLLRQMLAFSWPMLVLGLVGVLNQSLDKMIYPRLAADPAEGQVQLGIYGACVKIAMIMAMITQAFRYAYEPLVFSTAREGTDEATKKHYYAVAMKYFLIFTLLAFLGVVAYMDLIKHLIGRGYHEGLRVVPIVMAAEVMMGIYFNLSFWYKLIDRPIWGAVFSLAGCAVMLAINVWGIPRFGYMACAWAGFGGYATCMVLSYVVGQRFNPIPYPLRSMAAYTALAAVLYAAMEWLPVESVPLRLTLRSLLLLVYVAAMCRRDVPLARLLHRRPSAPRRQG